jgi:hypothetical protein
LPPLLILNHDTLFLFLTTSHILKLHKLDMSSPISNTLKALPRQLATPSSDALPPHTPTAALIKHEPSTTPIDAATNILPSHNRFAAVVRSHLPGRPDLIANSTPLTSSILEYSTPTLAPEIPTPPATRLKQEDLSTPTTTSDTTTILTLNLSSSRSKSDTVKPAHLDYLTNDEYAERVAHINRMRSTLAPTMRKSLALTQERAAMRRKKDMEKANRGDDAWKEEVIKAITSVRHLYRGVGIDIDSVFVRESIEGGQEKNEKMGRGALDLDKIRDLGERMDQGDRMLAKVLEMMKQ